MSRIRVGVLALTVLLPLSLTAKANESCVTAPTPASSQTDQTTTTSSQSTQSSNVALTQSYRIDPAGANAIAQPAAGQGVIEFRTGVIDIEPQSVIIDAVSSGVTLTSGGTSTITAGNPFRPPEGVKWETLADVAKWDRQRAKELRENAAKYREESKDKTKSAEFRKTMEDLARMCEQDAVSLDAQADRLESDKPPEAGPGPFPEATGSGPPPGGQSPPAPSSSSSATGSGSSSSAGGSQSGH